MASIVINALAPHVHSAAKHCVRWAGSRVAAAGVKFVEASHAARQFVRDVSQEHFEALTESEYLEAIKSEQRASDSEEKAAPDLIDFDDDQVECVVQSTDPKAGVVPDLIDLDDD
ncbi:hypothetical protein MMC09_003684 [Bachmanniomyces sp. S44760]|nr:hypothetical protein [Bachmanniomyces sp. S44760]